MIAWVIECLVMMRGSNIDSTGGYSVSVIPPRATLCLWHSMTRLADASCHIEADWAGSPRMTRRQHVQGQ